ncbi:presenilin family intramembrane aspartyl protease PSH [Halococcus salsus]|uniref:presenilin family intramembrane aspartyl protease PSH n=1 Tax=Halococcus salsus TaxID=2162894 RepID=UPI00135888E0|nr:presenilin family intramembrane aspartyl protease PSH [Halococcus salsus]
MHQRTRVYAAGAMAVAVFVLIQLGAVALVGPFERAGYQAVENPTDPANSAVYIGAILVATAAMLAVIKLDIQWLLRGFVVFSSGLVSLYVFSVLAPPVSTSLAGVAFNPLAVGGAVVLAVALLAYPEWYVIDAAGVVMGAGAAGIFGISFGLLPAILLLVALAVYDAISVYGTEHMLTLADGVMDLKLPVVLVIPLTLSYSFLDDSPTANAAESVEADGGEGEEGETDETNETTTPPAAGDRDVFFVGLGDAVMPGVLVASAAFFAPARPLIPGFALSLPALTAMVGTVCGLVVLLRLVMKGRAHAGLPLLNGGAIAGYLVGTVASGIPVVTALGLGPYL